MHAIYGKNALLWLKIRGRSLHAIYDKNIFEAKNLGVVHHTQYMIKQFFFSINQGLFIIQVYTWDNFVRLNFEHKSHAIYYKNALLWLKIKGRSLYAIHDKSTLL